MIFSSSVRFAALPYPFPSASLNMKSPKPNSSFMKSERRIRRVLEYFFMKLTPSCFAMSATLAWED